MAQSGAVARQSVWSAVDDPGAHQPPMGRCGMKSLLLVAGQILAATLLSVPAFAQDAGAKETGAREAGAQPGRVVVLSKCFQCHTDAVVEDHREGRRAWPDALYPRLG